MKETLDKIKEKYKNDGIAILLMLLFICAVFGLTVSQLSKDAAETSGHGVNRPGQEDAAGPEASTEEETGEREAEEEPESKTEDGAEPESGTEAADGTEKEGGAKTGDGTGSQDGERTFGRKTEETSEAEKDLSGAEEQKDDAGTDASYERFTLRDMKQLRGLEPVWLPDVTGPVEYRNVERQKTVRNFALLKKMVENRIAQYDGDWSVYAKNLSTGESFVVNDQPMKSASVMKLFIMGTVYKAMESGELERTDEVMSLINNMITVSDNESSNQLLQLLGEGSYDEGIARVDEFIREYGFSEMTVEYNGFNNSETVTDNNKFNQVSARDCGKLLEDIYRRSWVNRSVCNEIETMLLNQHTRYKIPAGLPEGVACGNKTGEMDTTENDAAIVYAENCDYILVVLSSDWNSKDEAISRIVSLSDMVYGFLN